MAYTARGLIDYARSISDLQNTKFISYKDELQLLNESYREVHSRYTESDGDYWTTEIIIQLGASNQDPNQINSYLVPLPADFSKIRSLSSNAGGTWQPCQRFSMSNRDYLSSQTVYRLKNNYLWVRSPVACEVKLNYYSPPVVLTAPDVDVTLATAATIYDIPTISSSTFDGSNNYFYILNNQIHQESLTDGTTNSIYTSANPIDNICQQAGWVYYRDGTTKNIYRSKSTNPLVPVAITSSGNIENFSIQSNLIYYSTSTETRKCALDGTLDSLVLASKTIDYLLINSNAIYIDSVTGFVTLNGVATTIPAINIRSDGSYLYVLDNRQLSRYDVTPTDLTFSVVIADDVNFIGSQVLKSYLPIITTDSAFAQSVVVDSILDFPVNETWELLAYMSAIAYNRKQADQTQMALLTDQLNKLWDRFWSVQKRDEYQPVRINNDYQQTAVGQW